MLRFTTQTQIQVVSRLLLVLAAVGVLCHADSFLSALMTTEAEDEVLVNVQTPVLKAARRITSASGAGPKPANVFTLSNFIKTRYRTSDKTAKTAASTAVQSSRETGLPATLILAVAGVESSFKPLSDNGVDKGIMQVNPKYHPEKVKAIGGPAKLFDVRLGMRTGALILKEYSDSSKSNVVKTLQRYNGSKTNVYPNKVLAEKKRFDRALMVAGVGKSTSACKASSAVCYTSRNPYQTRPS